MRLSREDFRYYSMDKIIYGTDLKWVVCLGGLVVVVLRHREGAVHVYGESDVLCCVLWPFVLQLYQIQQLLVLLAIYAVSNHTFVQLTCSLKQLSLLEFCRAINLLEIIGQIYYLLAVFEDLRGKDYWLEEGQIDLVLGLWLDIVKHNTQDNQ